MDRDQFQEQVGYLDDGLDQLEDDPGVGVVLLMFGNICLGWLAWDMIINIIPVLHFS